MNLAHDKKLHGAAGALITLLGYFAGDVVIGFVLAIAAGLIKEIYDLAHPLTHKADVLDFVATVCGGGAVFMVIMLIKTFYL